MAYSNLDKHTLHFNTVLYTGNNTTRNITGFGFQPDMIWVKARNGSGPWYIQDSVRGNGKYIRMNDNPVEGTSTTIFDGFVSDGFVCGSSNSINTTGETYLAVGWKADNTSGSSNSDGSITSTVSANTTSGFSIVSYTGNGTSGATVGHGLGVKPAFIHVKNLDSSSEDNVYYHQYLGGTKAFKNRATSNSAVTTAGYWNDTDPTNQYFTIGNDGGVNTSGQRYIAYCWAEVQGFSRFGMYKSNSNSNGPFSPTGMKPNLIWIYPYETADEKEIYDIRRAGWNQDNWHLNANLDSTEAQNAGRVDILSNGFKVNVAPSGPVNNGTRGIEYVTMAWGQPTVGSNNIQVTAR